jgi:hypothetical protein
MRFLPPEFEVPELLETSRFRIRPLTIHDLVKDYDAVMTSREHLWEHSARPGAGRQRTLPWSRTSSTWPGTRRKPNGARRSPTRSCAPMSGCSSAASTLFPRRSKALAPRLPCGSGPASLLGTWTRSCMGPCGAGLPIAGRSLGLPGQAGSCHGRSTTRCPTGDRHAECLLAEPGRRWPIELLAEAARSAGRAAVHPILVGLTESRDQRKGGLAQRSAVDL